MFCLNDALVAKSTASRPNPSESSNPKSKSNSYRSKIKKQNDEQDNQLDR